MSSYTGPFEGGCPACSADAAISFTRRGLLQGGAAALGAGTLGASVANAAPDDKLTLPRADKPLVIEPSWVLAWDKGEFKLLRDHSVVVEQGHIAEIRAGHRVGQDQRQLAQRAGAVMQKIWNEAEAAGWFNPTTR